jgi:uncharacterized glyoxalase superfamily protein PhnB
MAGSAPEGWHSVTPRIFARDPAALVAFLKRVFIARGDFDIERPTELWIGDSVLLISGDEVRGAFPAALYVYEDDVDAVFDRAKAFGATIIEEPRDLPYGDRRATFEDPWGNLWQVASRQG